MTEAIQPDQNEEKQPWEKPEISVVAITADIAGGANMDDDEDFTATPS